MLYLVVMFRACIKNNHIEISNPSKDSGHFTQKGQSNNRMEEYVHCLMINYYDFVLCTHFKYLLSVAYCGRSEQSLRKPGHLLNIFISLKNVKF